jgi:hypothetical protein
VPPGLPSHDTLSEGFGRIDRQALADALMRGVPAALPSLSGAPGCRDGKRRGGSREEDGAVHLRSAWAAKARGVLAPQAVADKSHDIPALPELLAMVEGRGAWVSIDAESHRPAQGPSRGRGGAGAERPPFPPDTKTFGCPSPLT